MTEVPQAKQSELGARSPTCAILGPRRYKGRLQEMGYDLRKYGWTVVTNEPRGRPTDPDVVVVVLGPGYLTKPNHQSKLCVQTWGILSAQTRSRLLFAVQITERDQFKSVDFSTLLQYCAPVTYDQWQALCEGKKTMAAHAAGSGKDPQISGSEEESLCQ